MALDSSFSIQTQTSLAEVQAVLTAMSGFRPDEDFDGKKVVLASGVVIDIYSPPIREYDLEQVGIETDVALFLSDAGANWTFNTVRAVMALLRAYPGDALFIYCCDVPALLRKNGRIILDRRGGLWDEGVEPNMLALVDLPYEFGVIPLK